MGQQHAIDKAHVWAAWDQPRPAPAGVLARRGTARSSAGTRVSVATGASLRMPRDGTWRMAGEVPGSVLGPATSRRDLHRSPDVAAASPGEPAAERRARHAPLATATVPTASGPAESLRRGLASAWGDIGSAWGVPPATARVHGYLLAHRRPLAEREIRTALGLSHRATSLALAESKAWGLVERVPDARRVGRRGPAGAAWVAVGDHWRWFGHVVDERRRRECDPVVAGIEQASEAARDAARGLPEDLEVAELRDWLADLLAFVRLVDRAASFLARVPPAELERAMRLLGSVPDDTSLRVLTLLAAVPDDDVHPLIEVLGRLSPSVAARGARLAAHVLTGLAPDGSRAALPSS